LVDNSVRTLATAVHRVLAVPEAVVKGVSTVTFTEDVYERTIDALGTVAKTLLEPWGGPEVCVDAYESAIRATSDAQLDAARRIPLEPVRAFMAAWANMTRDIGATQLSGVRWMLDV
jgi:hypothetical protein